MIDVEILFWVTHTTRFYLSCKTLKTKQLIKCKGNRPLIPQVLFYTKIITWCLYCTFLEVTNVLNKCEWHCGLTEPAGPVPPSPPSFFQHPERLFSRVSFHYHLPFVGIACWEGQDSQLPFQVLRACFCVSCCLGIIYCFVCPWRNSSLPSACLPPAILLK